MAHPHPAFFHSSFYGVVGVPFREDENENTDLEGLLTGLGQQNTKRIRNVKRNLNRDK